jgi:hypothetical protein
MKISWFPGSKMVDLQSSDSPVVGAADKPGERTMTFRKLTRRDFLKSASVAGLGAVGPNILLRTAHAQTAWKPERPIQVVIQFAAGGGTDDVIDVAKNNPGKLRFCRSPFSRRCPYNKLFRAATPVPTTSFSRTN